MTRDRRTDRRSPSSTCFAAALLGVSPLTVAVAGGPEIPTQETEPTHVVSDGPTSSVARRLSITSRGERLGEGETTDVWAHGGFAYTGTFNEPCGGDPSAGIWVWDVRDANDVNFVGVIPSPTGSRSNDVKVATVGGGDILVHSNERCAEGGSGGFEIYNVDDPANPVHLAHVQTDDINALLREDAGIVDAGVHNLFLWSAGGRDLVGAVVTAAFGNLQFFDITDPTDPQLVGWWGTEQLRLAELGMGDRNSADLGRDDVDIILDLIEYLTSGFGLGAAHRLIHDVTVSEDGTLAYVSGWDAGLVLLDIGDPSSPEVVSVAIDPENGSLDGEVNSHAAWPSEDGSIVVETEEDFAAWVSADPPEDLEFEELEEGTTPLPGTAVAAATGDAFEANPTGNEVTVDATSVVVDSGPLAGERFDAVEFRGDQPKFADTGPLTGEAVWIGQACDDDEILNAEAIDPGDIAVVRRGECPFREKNFNAAAAGAAAIVIANFEDTPWGGVRIWDYSDPTDPVLASTFNTTCSASLAPSENCDAAGRYSVHNVIVETRGTRTYAYFSWYWDGMLVVDVTDPYDPVEIARFFDNSDEFLAGNGGNPHDFWGVYKMPGEEFIYGADRNGGLYVFRELKEVADGGS